MQLACVGDALVARREAVLDGQPGLLERSEDSASESIGRRTERDVSVTRSENAERREPGHRVAGAHRDPCALHRVPRLGRDDRRERAEEGDVDVLAPSRLLAHEQRRERSDHREQRAGEIAERNTAPHRFVSVGAGRRHQPAQRLEDRVHPLPGHPGAEAADRRVDDPLVEIRDRFVADPDPIRGAAAEVLDDDVGLPNEVGEYRGPSGCLRFSVTLSLLRPRSSIEIDMSWSPSRTSFSPSSPKYGALLRLGSPPAGFSTLITVAPSAPSNCVA